MNFFTLSFAAVFTVLFFAWWAAPRAGRVWLLAAANLAFSLLLGLPVTAVLAGVTLAGFFAGHFVAKRPGRGRLWLGVLLLLAPLTFYKAALLLPAGPFAGILMPLGLSFYTFKSVSYLIEIARGHLQPETDFLRYFCYIGFFPQLPMGPIQRPGAFFAALDGLGSSLNEPLAWSGVTRICWALFLKKCLADPFSTYMGALASPQQYHPLSVVFSLAAYSLYLYFDFAAFSQMAIGLGELLGLPCAENFKSPYFARSVGDFWHRWHISLSSFLQQYIYFPLGGSRNGVPVLIFSTMATFLLSGLWHGVTGGFLVWGGLHGLFLLAGRATRPAREKLWAACPGFVSGPVRSLLAWGFTLCLVGVGWLFFYAETLPAALELWRRIFTPVPFSLQYIKESLVLVGFTPARLLRQGLLLALAALVDWRSRETGFGAWAAGLSVPVRLALCYASLFLVLFFGSLGSLPGVYFAF